MAIWTASRQRNGNLTLSKKSTEYGIEDLGHVVGHARDTETLMGWLINERTLNYGDVIVMPDRTYLIADCDASNIRS